jgi:diguanylate cyclase (GGDEF)-like protein
MATSSPALGKLAAGQPAPARAPTIEDIRSTSKVERLLEDSWEARSRSADTRERVVEAGAVVSFLACAGALAVFAPSVRPLQPALAATLVVLYAFTSRVIKFPIGAGYVVPSWLILVPMLLLEPPSVVPLLAAAGLMLGGVFEELRRGARPERVFFSIADAWHSLGPALVLSLLEPVSGTLAVAGLYTAAFAAGCLVDLVSSTLREAAAVGVAPHVQFRVILLVWLIDACLAPLGVLVALAVSGDRSDILLLLPFIAVMLLVSRDRSERIARAQRHLEIVARERSRLQNAVQCLGEAFAAKLDLQELTGIVLRGAIEALDADGGHLTLKGPIEPVLAELGRAPGLAGLLRSAEAAAQSADQPRQLQQDGNWALGVPISLAGEAGTAMGAIAVARLERPFREDELAVLLGLVEQARQAAVEIFGHEQLRVEALTDPLTKLGNRRKLTADVAARMSAAEQSRTVLALIDLDGFKLYNDTFGHGAGDELLVQLAGVLTAALGEHGSAYRLGGDEFCVVASCPAEQLEAIIDRSVRDLRGRVIGERIDASHGQVSLPEEALELGQALRIADQRMYARKRRRTSHGEQR